MTKKYQKLAQGEDRVIEYHVQGSGIPLVILPSLGRGAEDFEELASLLAQDGIKVIRPEPRGIGRSVAPMKGLTLQDLAADIALVIETELGRAPVHVAGHAFGNFVARMLATNRPDLVRAIALVAASPGKLPSGESPYEPDVLESIYKSGDMTLPQAERVRHLQRAFFAPGNDVTPWLGGWHASTKAAQAEASRSTPVDAYYAGGSAPIFHLQAADDTVAPARYSTLLRDTLGERVTIDVIANAGHALIPEQPKAVREALSRWAWSPVSVAA